SPFLLKRSSHAAQRRCCLSCVSSMPARFRVRYSIPPRLGYRPRGMKWLSRRSETRKQSLQAPCGIAKSVGIDSRLLPLSSIVFRPFVHGSSFQTPATSFCNVLATSSPPFPHPTPWTSQSADRAVPEPEPSYLFPVEHLRRPVGGEVPARATMDGL